MPFHCGQHRRPVSSPMALWPGLVILLMAALQVRGFNVDIKSAIVLTGPHDSSFGYSIRLTDKLPDSQQKRGFYVSAPKAKTPNTMDSGQVYKCPVDAAWQDDCTALFDQSGPESEMKDERFGSSIALLEGAASFLACSPARRDTTLANQHFYLLPGSCSLFSDKLTEVQTFNPYRKKQQYFVTHGTTGKQVPKFAYASFGFAADSDKKSVFVASVPGVMISEGILYVRDYQTQEYVESEFNDQNNATAYSYLGYSVAIGQFGRSSNVYIAAGAPGEYKVGAVHIFKWDREDQKLNKLDSVKGTQSWASFGSSLAAVNFDGDMYDELLVGSPYFTEESQDKNRFDQGRVFLYAHDPSTRKYTLTQTLVGSNAAFSKFGVSVNGIGDINMDSVPDIAVGAPWELEGRGCVYIFLGENKGVRLPYSQRITSEELPSRVKHPLQGIGFAISEGIFSNDTNSFPFFSATALSSSSVITMTGRPIVTATITLTSKDIITVNDTCSDARITEPCFEVGVNIKYNTLGKKIYKLDFNLNLKVDTLMTTAKRTQILLDDDTTVDAIRTEASDVHHQGRDFAFNVLIIMPRVEQNRITPVMVTAEFELLNTKPSHPILDQFSPRQVNKSISFQHECGYNNLCDVDLKTTGFLTYAFKGESEYSVVVVNGTTELIVNLEVSNSGEVSYWTQLEVFVDMGLTYLRGPTNCKDQQTNENQAKVMCLQKVVSEGGKFTVDMAFDTSNLPLDRRNINVEARAMPREQSQSKDKNLSDNDIKMKTEVAMISKVELDGSSLPFEVVANKSRQISLTTLVDIDEGFIRTDLAGQALNVTHRALVRNKGPSLLPETTIYIDVPYFSIDGIQVLQRASVQLYMTDGSSVMCNGGFDFHGTNIQTNPPTQSIETTTTEQPTTESTTTGSTTTEFTFPDIDANKRRKRSSNTDGKTNAKSIRVKKDARVDPTVYSMSCELHPRFCKYFECRLPSVLPPDEYATVDISMLMEKQNIPIPEGFSVMQFITTIQVAQPKHPLLRPWTETPKINLFTKFIRKKGSEQINIWIIIGSVVGGLVLITLITVVLWKCGFFKRDKHYQVERWRQQSVKRKTASETQ